MNRGTTNIDKNVILVVDDNRKRRIEKGYYGKIDLSKIAVVSSIDNIEVDEKPDISDLGKCTYIRSDFDTERYYRIDNYQYKCAEKRQSDLVKILKLLQISEYFVVSRFTARAEIGNKTNEKIEGNAKAGFLGVGLGVNGNLNYDQQGAFSANVGYHQDISAQLCFEQKYKEPTDYEWQEAKKIAIDSRLYEIEDVKTLVDLREPNKGSRLKFEHTKIRLCANIRIDVNLMNVISGLLCFNYELIEANVSGNRTKLFDFHAEASGEYVTEVIYNFDPNETERFNKLVESYK